VQASESAVDRVVESREDLTLATKKARPAKPLEQEKNIK